MLFPRIAENNIAGLLDQPEILILYGPRRVGKTTILKNLLQELQKQAPCALYTLDDPSSVSVFQNPSSVKLKAIFNEIGLTGERNYLLLDEIQSFTRIDLMLKLIYDHFPQIKVVATSSSSLLLLQNLTESLAGRKYFVEILPLTLAEYKNLQVKNYFAFSGVQLQKEELTHLMFNFCVFGSYPEVLTASTNTEKAAKLRDIIDSSLYKDIFILENIKAPKALITLVQLLAYQIGNLVNLNELATQIGISRNTVNEYISILEKFFIVFRLSPYEKNLRSEITSKFKIYFWDLGIRNAVVYRFSPFLNRDDKGALLENMIISSILKRNFYAAKIYQPFFWRTYEGAEIDLVLSNVQTDKLWTFQITTKSKARFSRTFDIYQPLKKITINLDNGYKFCL